MIIRPYLLTAMFTSATTIRSTQDLEGWGREALSFQQLLLCWTVARQEYYIFLCYYLLGYCLNDYLRKVRGLTGVVPFQI